MILEIDTNNPQEIFHILNNLKKQKKIKDFKLLEDIEAHLLIEETKKENNEKIKYEDVLKKYGINI